ncbi:GNAT family N-acetyltransferase [Micromonospora sp. CPCC 205561]|uniref:GNAT family N-acetyltransferase n=1 Tax=Micromonospora sp. CPCC 205561 TaxID=3122407 RepID=UPI002FF30C13
MAADGPAPPAGTGPTPVKIREVTGDERLTTSFPLQSYAFGPSSAPPTDEELRPALPYHEGNRTMVVQDAGVTVAAASAIPMWQNLRGRVLDVAGVAWVVTHPLARRRGHSRDLLHHLLGEMRQQGHVASALYPFRSSFYARFGYLNLPKPRTVTFRPEDCAPLLKADLPGDITWRPFADGYDDYRLFQRRLLDRRHGFAMPPEHQSAAARDAGDRWLATARIDGEVVGMVTYRIDGQGGRLRADDLLTVDAFGRALLLRFFALHVDQVSEVVLTVAADEAPELWLSDLTARVETVISFPSAPPPMARLLSVEGLRGVEAGPGRVGVEVVDDPFMAGRYRLDGAGGRLVVEPGAKRVSAVLTAAGLSGLVYGVLDPVDVLARGLGTFADDAVAQLRSLFPRAVPCVFPPR